MTDHFQTKQGGFCEAAQSLDFLSRRQIGHFLPNQRTEAGTRRGAFCSIFYVLLLIAFAVYRVRTIFEADFSLVYTQVEEIYGETKPMNHFFIAVALTKPLDSKEGLFELEPTIQESLGKINVYQESFDPERPHIAIRKKIEGVECTYEDLNFETNFRKNGDRIQMEHKENQQEMKLFQKNPTHTFCFKKQKLMNNSASVTIEFEKCKGKRCKHNDIKGRQLVIISKNEIFKGF